MHKLKIALTGCLGVIGRLLTARLEADAGCRRIVLLDLVPPQRGLRKSVFYRIDLTDPMASNRIADALRREEPDVFVHLAFLQHPIRNTAYEHDLESVGTMQVLHALDGPARAGRGPALVVASSTWLYGARPDNPGLLTEDAPLRGRPGYPFIQDKIDAEGQARRFAEETRSPVVVLRTAPLLGPGTRSLAQRYFALPVSPTVLGFNPLLQLLHPDDAAEAFCLAIHHAARERRSAVWNVVPRTALPLLAAIRLAGARSLPLPSFAASPTIDALFQAGAAIAPAAHLDYLRHLCLGDGDRAARELGFRATRSTRDVVVEFAKSKLRSAA